MNAKQLFDSLDDSKRKRTYTEGWVMTPRHKLIVILMILATCVALYVSSARISRQQDSLHLEQAIGNNPYIILLYSPYDSPALQGYCRTDDNCMDVLSVDDVDFKK